MKFWSIFRGKSGMTRSEEVTVQELLGAGREFQIRDLAFWSCVNLIAGAVGRCDFRTFADGKEIQGAEWYLWNVEPNSNQSSSAFLHEVIARLCLDNEALIVPGRKKKGLDNLLVAEDWNSTTETPDSMTRYHDVTVGGKTFDRGWNEDSVLHLRLAHMDLKPVIDGLYGSYVRMIDAAASAYERGLGQKLKVHVDQIKSGDPNFEADFTKMIQEQLKPFLSSNGAVLPEFDGYKYEEFPSGKSGSGSGSGAQEVQTLTEDIFSFTARAFLIPTVLINGKVEATKDANERFLTYCVDPILDQLQEEINRKRFGIEQVNAGTRLYIDSTAILHMDIFQNSGNIEKLVGSGVLSINDICRTMGLPPIPEKWADQHYMTLNIAKASEQTRAMEE